MKIAIFSDSFPPEINGVANFVKFSAESLAEKGNEVQVFTVSKLKKKNLNKNSPQGLVINTLPSLPALVYPDIRFTVPATLTLPKLKKFNPDVIHTHTPFALGWEALMVAKILKKPLVGTHHTFYDQYLKHLKVDFEATRKITWLYTVSHYNYCNVVTTPSHSLAEEMIKNGLKRKVEVLPNFVNTNIFTPPTKKEKFEIKKMLNLSNETVVYMGRLSYEKSVDLVIKSFYLARKKKPKVSLLIIGDGPEREKLKTLVNELKLSKAVVFTGFLRGKLLAKALQAGDIFFTASETETFCISALEAMAVGLPVVAVNKGGLGEIVISGENGLLSEKNKINEMAENLFIFLRDKKKIFQYGKKSREFSLKYSKEKVTEKLEKIYKKAIINNQ